LSTKGAQFVVLWPFLCPQRHMLAWILRKTCWGRCGGRTPSLGTRLPCALQGTITGLFGVFWGFWVSTGHQGGKKGKTCGVWPIFSPQRRFVLAPAQGLLGQGWCQHTKVSIPLWPGLRCMAQGTIRRLLGEGWGYAGLKWVSNRHEGDVS